MSPASRRDRIADGGVPTEPCTVPGCVNKRSADRDICPPHVWRLKRYGGVNAGPPLSARRSTRESDRMLREAAQATSDDCVYLTRPDGKRPRAKWGGVQMNASRVVWLIANGDPGAAHVLHTCHQGEEGCINIRHLYLGDDVRNKADMVAAGRNPRGVNAGPKRLTPTQAAEIRRRRNAGESGKALAREFGVSDTWVYKIARGDYWKDAS